MENTFQMKILHPGHEREMKRRFNVVNGKFLGELWMFNKVEIRLVFARYVGWYEFVIPRGDHDSNVLSSSFFIISTETCMNIKMSLCQFFMARLQGLPFKKNFYMVK